MVLDTTKELFLKLELSDIENKLRELLFSKHPIKIWKDSSQFASLKIHDVKDGALKIDNEDYLQQNVIDDLDTEYLIGFCVRGMSYYFKCSVENNEGEYFIRPSGYIYRAERRRDIRFIMHPKLNAFLYFQINEKEEVEADNVISINRFQAEEKKLFKEFDGEIKDIPELGGESILDISEGGLSFVCSVNELKLIKYSKPSKALLMMSNESINLEEIEFVYDVDYLNARMESIIMKKVGVRFSHNEKLAALLTKMNDDSIVLTSLDEEFQKFIDSVKE